jgi:serine/threonine-protein kinase
VDTTVADPLIGRLLDGRYRVDARLARGGMATVYHAVDTRLDRPVALKVMHPGLADDQAFVSRFIREARSAARLSHPGVVAVYDQGQDGGFVFLAMEYVQGRTLRDLIRQRGRLTPREALDVLEPVLSALGAAHRAGIVHRDVKPENVLLSDDGRVKVADFGLARSSLASGASASTQGVVMGTVAYLAPEQVERGVADARTDVYSAGILLYEMLTGGPPFSGETPMAVAYQHVTHDVPAPSAAVPGLAPELDSVVRVATDRDPDGRPDDASALLAIVQRARAALSPAQLGAGLATDGELVDLTDTLVVPLPMGPAAHQLPTPPGAKAGRGRTSYGEPGQPPTAARNQGSRRSAGIGLLVLLLVAALVGGVAWYLGSGRYTSTPSELGKPQAAAEADLRQAGLAATLGPAVYSEDVAKGSVVSTDPAPGDRVRKDGTVTLVLSAGPELHAVPDLTGKSVDDATAALDQAHLTLGPQTQAYSETVAAGSVISTDPAKGTQLRADTAVKLVVSKGVPPSTVPSFLGLTLDQARAAAAKAKLQVAVAPQGVYSEQYAQDQVAAQSTRAGTTVDRGATVTLTLSLGPPLVQVPDVFKMNRNKAKQLLEKAGFTVVFTEPFGVTPFDQVYSQNPSGGSMAPKGSTVTLGMF